jgi:hypothetical protein
MYIISLYSDIILLRTFSKIGYYFECVEKFRIVYRLIIDFVRDYFRLFRTTNIL